MVEVKESDGKPVREATYEHVRRMFAFERAHHSVRTLGMMLDYWNCEAVVSPATKARADEATSLADLLEAFVDRFAEVIPARPIPKRRPKRGAAVATATKPQPT